MNERIRELAEQAKKYALDAMIKITDKEQALKVYSETYDTKFAELIVQECLDACSRANDIKHFVPPTQEQVVLSCMREIETTFRSLTMKIFKYPLAITDKQELYLPPSSTLLSAREQNDNLCVWALVDDIPESADLYEVYVIGTGNLMELPSNATYLDTVVMSYGLVWHIFYIRGKV